LKIPNTDYYKYETMRAKAGNLGMMKEKNQLVLIGNNYKFQFEI